MYSTDPATREKLIPQQRMDRNGKLVTRWVKALDTDEPMIDLPSPVTAVTNGDDTIVLNKLFPTFDAEDEVLLDVFGGEREYTEVFSAHALKLLPPKTLRMLTEHLNEGTGSGQVLLAKSVYRYLSAMYIHGQEAHAQDQYDASVSEINNALVFHETLDDLVVVKHHTPMEAERWMHTTLYYYENPDEVVRSWSGGGLDSTVDYSKQPRRLQDEVRGFMVAFCLVEHCGSGRSRPSPELVSVAAGDGEWQRNLIAVGKERGVNDPALLERVLTSETVVLKDGML